MIYIVIIITLSIYYSDILSIIFIISSFLIINKTYLRSCYLSLIDICWTMAPKKIVAKKEKKEKKVVTDTSKVGDKRQRKPSIKGNYPFYCNIIILISN